MHESIAETIKALNVKLTGHYRYYGIYGNYIGFMAANLLSGLASAMWISFMVFYTGKFGKED